MIIIMCPGMSTYSNEVNVSDSLQGVSFLTQVFLFYPWLSRRAQTCRAASSALGWSPLLFVFLTHTLRRWFRLCQRPCCSAGIHLRACVFKALHGSGSEVCVCVCVYQVASSLFVLLKIVNQHLWSVLPVTRQQQDAPADSNNEKPPLHLWKPRDPKFWEILQAKKKC